MGLDTVRMRQIPVVRRGFSPNFQPDGNIIRLEDITPAQWEELEADESINPVVAIGQYRHLFAHNPLCMGYCYGGRIVAYFIADQSGPKDVTVRAVVSRKGASPAAFLQMTTAAIHYGIPLIGGDGYCWMEGINETSRTLIHRVCGGIMEPWYEGTALKMQSM